MLLDSLQARDLLRHAYESGYALLAVNADSRAAVSDCLVAASSCGAPIIIEASLWQLEGRSYGAGDPELGMLCYLADLAILANSSRFAECPVLFHTDHIKGPVAVSLLQSAIRGLVMEAGAGCLRLSPSTISLDASELSEDENIAAILLLAETAAACERPVTVEMESAVDAGLTLPEETKRLVGAVEERHPDIIHLFAPGLGTRHGLDQDEYSEFSIRHVEAHCRALKETTGRKVGLALHGSSGMKREALSEAARHGVTKVNWSSESLDLRMNAAREYYRTHPERFERSHSGWKAASSDNGLQQFISERYVPVVEDRIRLLGGAGMGRAFLSTRYGEVQASG